MRRTARIGDVFEVCVDDTTVRHFQCVDDDSVQLGSHVVRVFREARKLGETFDPAQIARGEVDFHAHVFLRVGLKQKLWRHIGSAPPRLCPDVLFRDSKDYGNPEIKISRNWYVWKVGGPFEFVGELVPRFRDAEIGVVVPPDSLVYRMLHGHYDFEYPGCVD